MKKSAALAAAVLCGLTLLSLMLGGCFAVSLRPLYLPGDLIYDPGLLGVWSPPDSKETWTFTREGDRQYRLVFADPEGKKTAMVAHLLEINGDRYLDLAPVDDEEFAPATFPMLPVHTFLAVERMQPTLRLAAMSYEWMDKYLKGSPGAIRHERVRQPGEGTPDQLLLTGSSRELQTFVRAHHHKTPGAFHDPFELSRRKP